MLRCPPAPSKPSATTASNLKTRIPPRYPTRAERLRRQVIEEWRLLPDPPDPLVRCVKASDAMAGILQKLQFAEEISRVVSAWREIVGDFLADNSQPVSLKDGVLLVQVMQPTLRYELDRSLKPQVLKRLQEAFGARLLKEIRFR